MPEAMNSAPFPLDTGSDGVIRVRGTRITLDTVWAAFNEGATAEEIVQQYPSLSLADTYQAIGDCLRHTAVLDAYLAKRSEIWNGSLRFVRTGCTSSTTGSISMSIERSILRRH